jgi:hypothetical protein
LSFYFILFYETKERWARGQKEGFLFLFWPGYGPDEELVRAVGPGKDPVKNRPGFWARVRAR